MMSRKKNWLTEDMKVKWDHLIVRRSSQLAGSGLHPGVCGSDWDQVTTDSQWCSTSRWIHCDSETLRHCDLMWESQTNNKDCFNVKHENDWDPKQKTESVLIKLIISTGIIKIVEYFRIVGRTARRWLQIWVLMSRCAGTWRSTMWRSLKNMSSGAKEFYSPVWDYSVTL